jgi:hypothetical protein
LTLQLSAIELAFARVSEFTTGNKAPGGFGKHAFARHKIISQIISAIETGAAGGGASSFS